MSMGCNSSATAAAAEGGGPVRKTSYGALLGSYDRDTGMEVYKGVPFAQALRYAEPTPPVKWEGIRPAVEFGPGCVSQTWKLHKMMNQAVSAKQSFAGGDLSIWISEDKWEEYSPAGFESECDSAY